MAVRAIIYAVLGLWNAILWVRLKLAGDDVHASRALAVVFASCVIIGSFVWLASCSTVSHVWWRPFLPRAYIAP